MPSMTSFHNAREVERLARCHGIGAAVVRRSRINFYRHAATIEQTLRTLASSDRVLERRLGSEIDFSPLAVDRRTASRIDRAVKVVSKTRQGFSIETVVLRPRTGRVALCVSSQVGCAAGCKFCATATMGVARNLSAPEIVEQVVLANRELAGEGQRVRNIVFMGMGEPMHNASAVGDAITWLTSPATIDHPPSRVLVSTVGAPEPWLRMVSRLPEVNYALSLHAARAETRRRIVPLAARHSLVELRGAVQTINSIQREKTAVMLEYVMLDGVNDQAIDIEALVRWVDGLRVHVNLIPFNAIPNCDDLSPSARETIVGFRDRLHSEGIPATIRYSLGVDIDAACGQLVRDENREVARQLARSRNDPHRKVKAPAPAARQRPRSD